ncbi:hypothetical protein [Modicisalibacter luteus]|uniref:Uncharacterized protein n=1 Tax=Modicisalibacter luteus TaxID=453962 RepID=A0ABV7LWF0_9GAMM|nr:hypothetical protein [Halomonas lutea]GHB03661.1 hypothetical protein GCM10007159_26860 [Halomonas lutea]
MKGNVLFLKAQCSKSEQELLRALRAIKQADSQLADVEPVLERLGIHPDDSSPFVQLIKNALDSRGEFELLGPKSPCVSRDELDLLATLNYFMKHGDNSFPTGDAFLRMSTYMLRLFKDCGNVLRETGIALRARPVPFMRHRH